jgi:hypothetical protein
MSTSTPIGGELHADNDSIEIVHIEDVHSVVEKPREPLVGPRFRVRVRRHYRHYSHGTADIVKAREEIGQSEDADGEPVIVRTPRPAGPVINFDDNFPRGIMSSNGAMPAFIDNSPNSATMANMSRQTPSPSPQHGIAQVNGGGGIAGMAAGLPMNAGHQMDLNNLYEMVVELSDVLKHNREMTRGIINSAEDIMVC